MLGGLQGSNTETLPEKQRQNDTVGPSPEAIAACDEFILDELWETLQLVGSYTNSALEACRRGDRDEIRLRLRVQLRDSFRHAVAVHDLLSPVRKVASDDRRAAA